MARRGARTHVELVDDDVDGGSGDGTDAGAPGPADPPQPLRGRRRAITLAAVLVVVLATVAVVGEVRQDARERERLAVLAASRTALAPLDGPPQVLWTSDREEVLWASARTPDGLLVVPGTQGERVVRALDPATGDVVWERELLPPRDTAPAPNEDVAGASCVGHGAAGDLLACLASDAMTVFDERTTDIRYVAPTVVRLVLLDPQDGTVVADLSDAVAGTGTAPAYVALGDLVVVSSVVDDATRVVAVAPDGSVAWRTEVPPSTRPAPGLPGLRRADVLALGDHLVVATAEEMRLLDATGATVRTVPLADDESLGGAEGTTAFARTGLDRVTLMQVGSEVVARGEGTKVVRADHVGELPGGRVRADVDDGSDPRLVLTSDAEGLHGWDAEGVRRWSADVQVTRSAMVLAGRVHATTRADALVTFDARTGAELWRRDGLVLDQAPLADGRVLLVRERGADGAALDLVALDVADGEVAWRTPWPEGVDQLQAVFGVIVGLSYDVEGEDWSVTALG
ncbi:Pyrrolo-quinoline quinone [Cellulomonas flavigena DSM 20109]|uniref:Pyrrolo-quinoline quinone n=1 Tax=Cellulomonas flavigena (strain ATCC 482 / DSM 20109 / BCRC 11376 / JCM 18109 / NBRC 3775 / NCIMB 8073 / NRS 134) TaxID=446466 RepID=D5UFM7_CELFN|nr:PQQ-binding-like beta-propeller repeat protein [Cellulomonas flavigena]ADG72986.1 Pyrrolo-quinoline quinone [Cellulomonas flavigena DSM 20109]